MVDTTTSLIQVLLDKAEQRRTVKGLQEVGQAGRAIGGDVEAGVSQAKRQLQLLERDARDLRERVGAGGDVSTNLSALSALGRLGGADIGVTQDVVDLVEQLPLLKQSLQELPSAIGAAVSALGIGGVGLIGGVVALGVAFAELNRQSEQANEQAREQLDFETRLALLRKSATGPELDKQIADAQQSRQNALEEVATATERFNRRIAHLPIEQQESLRQALAENRAFSDATLNQARIQIEEQSKLAEQATIEIINLNQLRKDEQVVTRDLAAAEEELAKRRQLLADRAISAELQATLQAMSLNADQLKERLKALNDEQKLIMAVVASGEASVEMSEQLTQRSRDITAQIKAFTAALPRAEQQQQQQQQKAINDKLIELAKGYEADALKIAEDGDAAQLRLEEQYADRALQIVERYGERTAHAVEQLEQQKADLVRDASRETLDATRQAEFDRASLLLEFNQQTLEDTISLKDRIKDIRDRARFDSEDLIRDRDFAGLRRLQQQRNQDIDNEVDMYNAAQRARERQLRYEQEASNRQLLFEAESRRIQFEQQIEDAREQYQRELDLAARERDKQLQALETSKQKELAALSRAEQQRLNLLADTTRKQLDLERMGAEARLRLQAQLNEQYLNQANQLLLGVSRGGATYQSFSSSPTFNITAGNSPAQQQGLVNLIEQVSLNVLRKFYN